MDAREHRGELKLPEGSASAPLSFGQERLFLLDRIMPGVPAYNVPRVVRVRATLDETLLQRALDAIVARHDILRTTIHLEDGEPRQRVGAPSPVELTTLDLRDAPGDRYEQAFDLISQLACKAFDLSNDVLLRAALVHVDADEDVLLLVNHHIGSDHASAEILFGELDAFYSAFRDGQEAVLPELTMQYGDFANWQREHLRGEALDELVEYWHGQLAGAPSRLEVPTDRQRPAAQSYRGALYEFTLEQELTDRVRAFARGEAASVFMVLVAAFNTLLHRYTGATDIVIGTPVSGRHDEAIEPLLGFFSNTLVLRTDLSGDPSFSELIARVKGTTMEARAYQELPFEKLVETLNPERTPSHSPLFQVLLGFDVAPKTSPTLGGEPVEAMPTPGWKFARLDLSLIIRETIDGPLAGSIEYATDLFDLETVRRIVGHLETILDCAMRSPGRPLSMTAVMTTAEIAQLTSAWNATTVDYAKTCLHEQFAAQAVLRPDAVAVACGDESVTYRMLDEQSSRIANELIELGVEPGSLVGLCIERSLDLVAAMMGVLKAGAAYVPIDPSYPAERRDFILADAAVSVVITQEDIARELGLPDTRLLCLDRDHDRLHARTSERPAVRVGPESLAYVIFTSGSTGKPKGVEITHRSVANLLAHMSAALPVTEADVVANLTTPAFDLSVPDWYLPLTTGATLAIVSPRATRDAVLLGEELTRHGATVVQATPTTWQLLVDSDWPGTPGLRIVAGGEALPRQLANDLQALGTLWHAYGPTETTVWSSLIELGRGDGPTPIGGPIANTSFYVLDSHRQLVPIGVAGELHIGGEGLARGYHHRDELTAERFVEGPATTAGARLYRTGDLLRWRADGNLEFLGRIDHQVKLRGFRIELGEIEAVLAEHPTVESAAAIVREDTPGDRRLIAYVVPRADEAVGVDELRDLVRARLPQYMTPAVIVPLESMPVNANGKLDRAALPAPDGSRRTVETEFHAPETPIEELLASIWTEILGVERVGIDDDFFDLGGHSLLAVKMTSRIQGAFDVELPLADVFARPTVRELAAAVGRSLTVDAGDDELAELLREIEEVES